jgi:hypothetical protein
MMSFLQPDGLNLKLNQYYQILLRQFISHLFSFALNHSQKFEVYKRIFSLFYKIIIF